MRNGMKPNGVHPIEFALLAAIIAVLGLAAHAAAQAGGF